jgi:hypothetical protein
MIDARERWASRRERYESIQVVSCEERGLTELPQKPHNAEKLRTGHRTLREWILQAALTSSRRGESDIAHHTETDQDRKNDFCGKQGTFVTIPYDRQSARMSPIRPTINCSSRELDRRHFFAISIVMHSR